ncbi:MAG: RluA family pseudouridine synthase [Planctomycetota bacterium]
MIPLHLDYDNLTPVEIAVNKSALEDYRLDIYLTRRFPDYSRSLIQKLIRDGLVTVSNHSSYLSSQPAGRICKPSYQLHQGDLIKVNLPGVIKPQMIAEDIPLNILYEDAEFIAINKPTGMVVHPAGGNWAHTLANALLHHCGTLPIPSIPKGVKSRDGDMSIYRPGIVHRLDKETSGLILAAKTVQSHNNLSQQFEKRLTQKEYIALVEKSVRSDSNLIDKPIGRHVSDYKKMAISAKGGKGREAVSFYEVLERFEGHASLEANDTAKRINKIKSGEKSGRDKKSVKKVIHGKRNDPSLTGFSLVRVAPKTGRTHQIRVHLASIGHPVVCDKTYGIREELFLSDIRTGVEEADNECILNRQALHAAKLSFFHPRTKAPMTLEAPLAEDIKKVVELLHRRDAKNAEKK